MLSIETVRNAAHALWVRVRDIPVPIPVRIWVAESRYGHTLERVENGYRCRLCGGRWSYKPVALFEPCHHWY